MTQHQFLCTLDAANEPLANAVIEQFGGWEAFTDSAPDVAANGIAGGFHGWIYIGDTTAFTQKNLKNIRALVVDRAKEYGLSPLDFVASFGCYDGYETGPDPDEVGEALYLGHDKEDGYSVLNALAWFTAEVVCYSYMDAVTT